MPNEVDRIRSEYARRAQQIPKDFYALSRPANLFAYQQKNRQVLKVLDREGLMPLEGKTILDVGCGNGEQLLDLVNWGAHPADLAGIDLIEARVAEARTRFGRGSGESGSTPDLRCGDASRLPWPDDSFDIVHQSTVFTSIIDGAMKRNIATEILRVLKPRGILIWYDFLFDNPQNPNVRGIGAREVRSLFPRCSIRLKRITLAPPIARRLVPITWIGALLLERLTILNTHYLAIIRKPTTLEEHP